MIATLPKERNRLIFWMLLLAHVYFFQIYPNFMSTTELSRFLLVSAIVEDHTVQIDNAIKRYGDCQDKAVYDGHFYSDKAIGPALLAVPFYAVFRAIGRLFSVHGDARVTIFLLRLFCITIPSLFFLRALTGFWTRIENDQKWIPVITFVFLFGTIVFLYSQQFVGHHLMGVTLFLSFYFLHRGSRDASNETRDLFLAGAFSGAALLCEYPAVFPVGVLFLYMIWCLPNRVRAIWYLMGVLPFACILLFYNVCIFGTPFDVTYRHMADPAHVAAHGIGFVGMGLPDMEALRGLLISRGRGLFFSSPVLLFSIPGFYFMFKERSWRKEAWLFAGITIAITGFHSGMSNWDGGWAFGPRYLTSAIPFLATAILFFFKQESVRSNRWICSGFALAGLWSVLVIVIGTVTFPFPPIEVDDPFFKLNLPLLFSGAFGKNLGSFLPSFGTIILFFTILLIIFLILTEGSDFRLPDMKSLAGWTLPFALIAILFLAGYRNAQTMSAFDYFARGSIFYYLGKYERSLIDLQTGLTRSPNGNESRLIQFRMLQVSQKMRTP